MADEGWKIAISGLSEIADYYLKSKALDMTEGQLALQQANRIAEQEIKERERRHDKEWQYQMFEYQDKARQDAAFAQRQWQAGESQLNRDAQRAGQYLSVLTNEYNRLFSERKATEKTQAKEYAGIQPEYKTDAYNKATEDMKIGADDYISRIERQIGLEKLKIEQLNIAAREFSEQRALYETMLGDSTSGGLDAIVYKHELEDMITKSLDNLGQSDQDAWWTRGGTDLPGFRAAYLEGGSNMQRRAAIDARHAVMNKEINTLAQGQYEQLRLGVRGDKAFVDKGKIKGLGINEDMWKKAFPKTWKKAMGAFGNSNWIDFMATLKADPVFYKELMGQEHIREPLKHLDYHHNRKMSLANEKLGLPAVGYTGVTSPDLDQLMVKFNAMGPKTATKEELYRFMKNNVLPGMDPGLHKAMFTEIENELVRRSETGDTVDYGLDYYNWYQDDNGNPEDAPDPPIKPVSFWEGEQFKYNKDVKRTWNAMPAEMQSALSGMPQENIVGYLDKHNFKAFVEEYNEAQSSNLNLDEFRSKLEREKFWAETYPKKPVEKRKKYIKPPTPMKAGPITGSLLNLMLGGGPLFGFSKGVGDLIGGKGRETDPYEDMGTISLRGGSSYDDVLRLNRNLPEQKSKSWQAMLDLYGSADSTYKSHIDSSYRAIEDSLLKLNEDQRMKERQIGNYWGITDADDFFQLAGTDKQWQYDMALDAFPEFKALYENYDAQGNPR